MWRGEGKGVKFETGINIFFVDLWQIFSKKKKLENSGNWYQITVSQMRIEMKITL